MIINLIMIKNIGRHLMLRYLYVMFLLVAIAGCGTPSPVYRSTENVASSIPTGCVLVAQHLTKEGEVVLPSYQCPVDQIIPIAARSGCSTVSGYLRQDGAYVSSHQRCKTSAFAAAAVVQSSTPSIAPCVSGACGPIQVKGYTRKDGTYVQPHTRSSRK